MPEMEVVCGTNHDPVQAAELALLVDLEARWENLRTSTSRPADVPPSVQDLHGKQKAYEAFRTKLAGYYQRYGAGHVPELLLNTPVRLGLWCRAMRDLYVRVEHDPRSHCPIHLVEKAYRWADRVAAKRGKECIRRSTPPETIRAAIRDLESLVQWCDELAGVTPVESQPARDQAPAA